MDLLHATPKLKLRKKRQVRKGCKGDSSCPTGMICYCKKPYRGMCTKNQGFCVYKYDLADKTVGFSYEPSNIMSKTKKYKKGEPCKTDLECKDSGLRRCGNSDIEYDGQSYTLKPKGTNKDSQCLGTRETLKEISGTVCEKGKNKFHNSLFDSLCVYLLVDRLKFSVNIRSFLQ